MGSVYQMVKDSPFPMVEEWIARNIPLEPDQHGYREGVLRIGDIQRAIISVYDFTYISEIYMEEAVNALSGCLAAFSVENGIDDAVLAEYPVLHGNLGLYFFKIFLGFHSVFGIKKILYHT